MDDLAPGTCIRVTDELSIFFGDEGVVVKRHGRETFKHTIPVLLPDLEAEPPCAVRVYFHREHLEIF